MEGNDQEFLRALHEEKIRTQNERAKLITMKLAFVTVLFGLSSVNMKIEMADIFWLIYFVPLVSISYDLYIMSADSRIKRIGIFLGRNPISLAGKAEQEWSVFAPLIEIAWRLPLICFFSVIVTLAPQPLYTPSSAGLRNLCGYGLPSGWSCLWLLSLLCGWGIRRL